MLCRRDRVAVSVLAAVAATALSACGGGTGEPVSPAAGGVVMLSGVPANHGLAPLERFELQAGASEEHGNVVISCASGGPDCVVQVAADGTIGYESDGGQPTVSLIMFTMFTPAELEDALDDLRRGAQGVPALVWHGTRYPTPEAAICLALIIDCEGGLGPIHYGAVDDLNLSGFTFLGRHNGVSLAEKTVVPQDANRPAYRAFGGWLEHGFFLIETPDGRVPGDVQFDHRYYRAYSVGDATGTSPAVAPGGAATWSGAMWGLLMTNPDQSEPDAFVRGDATVTVFSPQGSSGLEVDVTFSDITNEATGTVLPDMLWSDLPLQDGSFGIGPVSADDARVSRHPASHGISGRFYGPGHEEVGGLFGRSEVMLEDLADAGVHAEISGAFGARRD